MCASVWARERWFGRTFLVCAARCVFSGDINSTRSGEPSGYLLGGRTGLGTCNRLVYLRWMHHTESRFIKGNCFILIVLNLVHACIGPACAVVAVYFLLNIQSRTMLRSHKVELLYALASKRRISRIWTQHNKSRTIKQVFCFMFVLAVRVVVHSPACGGC